MELTTSNQDREEELSPSASRETRSYWAQPVVIQSTPWTAARQALLSFTVSWILFELVSSELVMLSNHLILCHLLLLLPSMFPSIRVFWAQPIINRWHLLGCWLDRGRLCLFINPESASVGALTFDQHGTFF